MPPRSRLEPDNDLLDGTHEWRPVQEIVRLTFKALHDVVRAQAEAIREVERLAGTRVSRPEQAAALAEKVSIAELSQTFDDLSAIIDAKLDAADAAGALDGKADKGATQLALQLKADHAEVQRCLDAKADVEEVQKMLHHADERREASEESRTGRYRARLLAAIDARADQLQTSLLSRLTADGEAAVAGAKAAAAGEAAERAVAGLRGEVSSLRGEVSSLRGEVSSLYGEVSSLRGEIAEAVAARPTKAAVAAELRKKTGKADVEAMLSAQASSLDASLASKADAAALAARPWRADVDALFLDRASLFLGRAELSAARVEIEALLSAANREAAAAAAEGRATCGKLERELAAAVEEMRASLGEVQSRPTSKEVEALLSRRPDRSELEQAVEAVTARGQSDARRLTGEARAEFEERSLSLRAELSAEIGAVASALRLRPERNEMEAALAEKATVAQLRALLPDTSPAAAAADAASNALAAASRALSLCESTRRELRQAMNNLEAACGDSVAQIQARLSSQPDASAAALQASDTAADAMRALAGKADIDEVNASLMQVNRELSLRPTLSELNRVVSEQSLLMESLCAEHLLGRWLWKTGKTKSVPGGRSGGAVPWNVQNVNTNPANFLWERDRSSVTCVAPGLYEVSFGFFSRKKPTVQLLVNGEPVLSAVNSASYAVHHSSGRLAAVGPHSAGNVTGLTLLDFVALPPNAKVACTYQGEDGAEGFLGLRKM